MRGLRPTYVPIQACLLIHHNGTGDGKCVFSVKLDPSHASDITSFEHLSYAALKVMNKCIPRQGSGGVVGGIGR